jgi:hypothetical protein
MTLTTLLRRTRQQHALAHHVTREVHPVEWRPLEHRWGPPAALALLCAALFFYGINIGELYRTEALRALIARGFLESGNWLVPTLYGEPLLTKPPVMYSAIAACGWFFGEITEWSARLPSALAATALVFLFYWYARRQLGSIGGLIVAAILPCGFLWLDKAAAAEIDMLQVAWTGAALLFFFRAAEACERPGVHGFGWWLAALLCVAGGALTKWTTPVFFYATAIGFLAWRKQLRLLIAWPHLLCGLIGAGVCFVWVAAVVHLVGFDTLYETIYMEAAPRLSHQLHDRSADVQLAETLYHPLVGVCPVDALAGLFQAVGRTRATTTPGIPLLDLAESACLDLPARSRDAAQFPAIPRPGWPWGDGLGCLCHAPATGAAVPLARVARLSGAWCLRTRSAGRHGSRARRPADLGLVAYAGLHSHGRVVRD